jgi:hypothetical protein
MRIEVSEKMWALKPVGSSRRTDRAVNFGQPFYGMKHSEKQSIATPELFKTKADAKEHMWKFGLDKSHYEELQFDYNCYFVPVRVDVKTDIST